MIICNLNICWTSLLVLTLVILFAMSSDAGEKYVSVDFEVFGNVQGVCFRMYTEEEGKKLGVTGWVKNTRQGTVIGQVQGPPEKVKEMKYWLSKVGSPSSRIHRAQFTNERDISKLEIRGFGTRY
ncbi:acylphosphatase-2 isoform X1 [Ctenopharyngodon idella]|uniref:acylphosphatase-2 isoform X1 n=2 Tax=Ctenopharyngodon idella TaxID=7959 RepID=UPI00222F395F|nr:acylphosphatase-2 isoform X1 [Ctenopharyngodon idella]